ncbi:response regulator [Niveibacterium sp. 24ML]|uniref:response regulator n=1 Tax=Niveibacterium sp. 24ML TaxID=2985512 RepID=UPI00226F2FDC|nr:response regulator [Niveibacterium sp. 24ML]MCX9157560.1 response regulator [Niveibacterium sp. 24ML]
MDELLFIEDEEAEPPHAAHAKADAGWVVMVVDDDHDVHTITGMALKHFRFQGRPLHFIDCYSGDEALAILPSTPEIALILLDIVMERIDAGLAVIRALRAKPAYDRTQIVIRTAAGGYCSRSALEQAGINGFAWKSEIDKPRLERIVTESLTAYCAASARAH